MTRPPRGRTARLARLLDLLRQAKPPVRLAAKPGVQPAKPGRDQRDEGAAALEAGLVLLLLISVAALLAPLPYAMLQKSRLEVAAARTARWATSAPGGVRQLPFGDPGAQGKLQTEAVRAYGESGGDGAGLTAAVPVETTGQQQCPLRRALRVQLSVTVGLGPFAPLLSAAGITGGTSLLLTAGATACEE